MWRPHGRSHNVTAGLGGTSAHWVGVGLGNTADYPLVQAGETSPASGSPWAWVETFYYGTQLVSIPVLTVHPGDILSVHVTFTTSGSVGAHIVDETTGGSSTRAPQSYPGMRPDGHAEVITEDPNGGLLANFGKVTFTGAQAYSATTGWEPLGDLSYYSYNLVQNGSLLAYPGLLDSAGNSFTNYWEWY
jgi:Peptidase A4 family